MTNIFSLYFLLIWAVDTTCLMSLKTRLFYRNIRLNPVHPQGRQGRCAEDQGRGDRARRHPRDLRGRQGPRRLQAHEDLLHHPQVGRHPLDRDHLEDVTVMMMTTTLI